MLVVGDRECDEGTVAVRGRADGDLGAWPVAKVVEWASAEIRTKGRQTVKALRAIEPQVTASGG
jgi:threonyl-tRNA synthetase